MDDYKKLELIRRIAENIIKTEPIMDGKKINYSWAMLIATESVCDFLKEHTNESDR